MKEEKKIMYNSPEAATLRTGLSGWVSSTGRYWGQDEHMARWEGCTHIVCECGNETEKNWTACKECRRKNEVKHYMALPEVPFDQVETCMLYNDDKFFFHHEDVAEYLEDNELNPEDIMLQVCEPQHKLSRVCEDQWNDELPEDWELPDEIQKALNALNEAIDKHSPTIWWGVKKRTTFKPFNDNSEL